MTSPATSTWAFTEEEGGAQRPTLVTLGGGLTVDAEGTEAPPRDGTELYADMVNQWQTALAGVCQTVPFLTFTIAFAGGVPFIAAFQCTRPEFEVSDLAVTDNATGDTFVAWDSWRLPPITCDPHLSINEFSTSVNTGCIEVATSPPAGKTQIRIRTQQGSTLTNIRCTASIQ